MKRKNFPGRKLVRQLKAQGEDPEGHEAQITAAEETRTKKHRNKPDKKRG